MMQSSWSDGILYLLTGLFITDLCVTVATVVRMNARLTQIDEIASRIREISNSIGSVMAEGVLVVYLLARIFRIKETTEMFSLFGGKALRLAKKLARR